MELMMDLLCIDLLLYVLVIYRIQLYSAIFKFIEGIPA